MSRRRGFVYFISYPWVSWSSKGFSTTLKVITSLSCFKSSNRAESTQLMCRNRNRRNFYNVNQLFKGAARVLEISLRHYETKALLQLNWIALGCVLNPIRNLLKIKRGANNSRRDYFLFPFIFSSVQKYVQKYDFFFSGFIYKYILETWVYPAVIKAIRWPLLLMMIKEYLRNTLNALLV